MTGRPVRCTACGETFVASETIEQRPPAPQPASPALAAVGRFVVRKRLGAGAFGTVYRAYDPQLDRDVALKVPNAGVMTDARRVERFLREAKAAANLRHPHIVPVFDAGRHGDSYYIASAFIAGKPLADTIPEAGDDFRRAARVVRELAEALAYAHEQGIVHRDVKPANLMLDGQDRVHLMDFGLASRQDEASRLTNDGAVMGTPSYMSPEQARGQKGEAQPAADQYAAGCVLYELLTGRPPFNGPPAVVIAAVLTTEPDPPRKYRPGVPADLETICSKAMSKRPEDRYPDCRVLADDLRRWLDGEPIAARRASAAERAARWVRKNPAAATAGVVTTAAGVLAVVAAALGVMYQNADRLRAAAVEEQAKAERAEAIATGARREAERQRAAAAAAGGVAVQARDALAAARETLARVEYGRTMQVAHQEWREGNVGASRRLLEATRPDLRGWEWRYLDRLCNADEMTLRHDGDVWAVSFSPDGTRILTGGRTARVWDAKTGKVRLNIEGSGPGTNCAAYSSDGTRIVTGNQRQAVKVWDAVAGVELASLKGHTGHVLAVAFSPDRGRIVTAATDGTTRVWDANTGAEVYRLNAAGAARASFSPDGTRILTTGGHRDPQDQLVAKVWDAATGAELLALKGHLRSVGAAVFSPDGSRVVTGSMDGTARVWNARTGAHVLTLWGHTGAVSGVAFSPDGGRVVTAGEDRTARVWDAKTGAEVLVLRGHADTVYAAAFSPDGSRVVTGSMDGTAKVWDARAGAEFRPNAAGGASFTADGTRTVSHSSNQVGAVYDAHTGRMLTTLKGHTDRVAGAALSRDGAWVVTAGLDNVAKVWDARTGAEVATLRGHTNGVLSCAFSPDGAHVVTGSYDRTARVWDAKTGAELFALKAYTIQGSTALFSPDGAHLLTAGGGVKVWDAKTGVERLELKGAGSEVDCAAYAADGGRIVTGSRDGAARVWDAKTGAELLVLKGHTGPVHAAGFSPDGARIVTGSLDRTARVWDAASGAELLALKSPNQVMDVAFAPDGERLFVFGRAYDARPFADTLRELRSGK
jgi:WD40 repeat protein